MAVLASGEIQQGEIILLMESGRDFGLGAVRNKAEPSMHIFQEPLQQ